MDKWRISHGLVSHVINPAITTETVVSWRRAGCPINAERHLGQPGGSDYEIVYAQSHQVKEILDGQQRCAWCSKVNPPPPRSPPSYLQVIYRLQKIGD